MSIFSDLSGILQELKLQTLILKEIHEALVPKPAVKLSLFLVDPKDPTKITEVKKVGFQLQDTGKQRLRVSAVDADGNPTPFPPGFFTPVWSSSDMTRVAVTPDPAVADGSEAIASGTGGLGDAQVNVTAGPLSGAWSVTLVAGPPAALKIDTVGDPF